ncbi:uncharacterized protein LOC117520644 [Thalassophryne amazonica]|uniref:uncharacterized protein LOC117520644 n=1 Tax=Thalassophryne amazonica TaxID=390379 RepID=UPI001471D465|nr:uncharacterized protein LOC117520644 [Thalassophryne amazonica]
MNPVSYQNMASSVNGGYQNLGLDRVLTTSNVMYCEKCGFPSTDAAAFKKHMMEHMGTRFYCLYCNHVAYSEAELNIHQKQHGTIYPFKCHHCGQGYMRRLCLVKHIERLHSKDAAQGPVKADMVKLTHAPVSRASPSAEPPPVRPLVRVTVPTPSTPITIPGKVEQRGKPLDSTVSVATKGDTEHPSPLNGLIQHNRALTVSLPEEVSIPAGCLVELVEVKTVNGSKELKLRLVSQQENESATKDTRTTVLQNPSPGKPLSSNLSNPNSMRSASMGMCTVNRKQCETKNVNVDHPPHPVSIPKILPVQSVKEKCSLKRTSPEITNAVIPVKVSKTIPSPVREGNCGIKYSQRELINPKAAHSSTVYPSRITNRLTSNMHTEKMGTCVPQRVADERKNFIPEPSQSIQPRRASDTTGNHRDVSKTIKVEPEQVCLKGSTALEMRKDVVCLNQQSLKPPAVSLGVPLAASSQGTLSALLARKERGNTASPSFQIPGTVRRTLNGPSSVTQPVVKNVTSLAGVKMAGWSQAARSSERAAAADKREPESFPVISSVFSLSQHPEDVQSSIKPLVIALRGIVMNKSNCSDNSTVSNAEPASSSKDYTKERPTSRCSALAVMKAFPSTNQSLMKQTGESVKSEESDKTTRDTPTRIKNLVSVKEEGQVATFVTGNKSSQNLALNATSLKYQETVSEAISADPARPICLTEQYERDASSRFMTVSLKKVQVGVWKKCKKRLKLKITNCKTQPPNGGLNDCAVYHPMPLKVDQLVKRPSQYQPVVVLNHPKPRAPLSGMSTANVSVTGSSEVVPKCQILKMRLSKVMGQKYEVMGCTVRVLT